MRTLLSGVYQATDGIVAVDDLLVESLSGQASWTTDPPGECLPVVSS